MAKIISENKILNNKNLIRLIETLIPNVNDAPSGVEAGVQYYLVKALNAHRKNILPSYEVILKSLEIISKEFYKNTFWKLDDDHAEIVVSKVQVIESGAFESVRNLVFEGYFAHPRWRDGKGKSVWSAIGFRPILRNQDQFGEI
ncbi:MAG: hypothetical protein DHS20C13_08780 [Thermodesulfobacteriota bacterium]|nr:MAG: hypothetical protein DHS20C13_08780 [Thermodesulfobacteriota bacterium]